MTILSKWTVVFAIGQLTQFNYYVNKQLLYQQTLNDIWDSVCWSCLPLFSMRVTSINDHHLRIADAVNTQLNQPKKEGVKVWYFCTHCTRG